MRIYPNAFVCVLCFYNDMQLCVSGDTGVPAITNLATNAFEFFQSRGYVFALVVTRAIHVVKLFWIVARTIVYFGYAFRG